KGFSGPESWIPTFVGMTGFNDAAGNEKIETKHLPSTCRDKSTAVCTKHHAPISNAFQENGAF
ncbi:TPA: hypothetical protein ACMW36_002175, partial [Neisseria gonorrhoeae]